MMNQKTGLVLEGGAMRGLFSAGVLDVMMENGIEFDGIMGVSACSLESLRKTGDLYGVQFCYDEIPNNLGACHP